MENNNTTQRILSSLDNIEKAGAPDFFYTRLIGRMQNVQPEQTVRLQLRPAILTFSLSVVLCMNILVLTRSNAVPAAKSNIPEVTSNGAENTAQSFANAYNLNTESVYE